MLDWLFTTEAQNLLEEFANAEPTPAIVSRLRKKLSVQQVAMISEQVDLRKRARAKFRHADRMFFTRVGLEQATDEAIARYKAKRFASAKSVIDICSGVGGDLTGFAYQGINTIGIDCDETLTAFANQNAGHYLSSDQTERITTKCQTADREVVEQGDAWHADPDRRIGGKRSTQPTSHEPSLEELEAWREAVPSAAIKFAPAARLPEAWQATCELEWISRAGECRQLVAWSGNLTSEAGLRRATRLSNDLLSEASPDTFLGEPDLSIDIADSCKTYLYEPDSSILASHLSGALAAKWELLAITPGVPYLTSEKQIEDRLLARFQIDEELPFDRKKIRKWLVKRSVGRLEIKCRAVPIDPAALRKQLKPTGDNEATLLIAPSKTNRNKPQVFVGRRC